jgi:hypothetical protein
MTMNEPALRDKNAACLSPRVKQMIVKLIAMQALIDAAERGSVVIDFAGCSINTKITLVSPPETQG